MLSRIKGTFDRKYSGGIPCKVLYIMIALFSNLWWSVSARVATLLVLHGKKTGISFSMMDGRGGGGLADGGESGGNLRWCHPYKVLYIMIAFFSNLWWSVPARVATLLVLHTKETEISFSMMGGRGEGTSRKQGGGVAVLLLLHAKESWILPCNMRINSFLLFQFLSQIPAHPKILLTGQ